MIGTILLLTVAGMLTSWLISRSQRDVRVLHGTQIGAQMVALNDVSTDFTLRYKHEIMNSIINRCTGSNAIELPTIGERIAARDIDHRTIEVDAFGIRKMADVLGITGLASTSDNRRYKLQFTLSVPNRSAAESCSRAGSHCFIDTLLYRAEPLRSGSQPDFISLNAATRSMGAGAGYSHPAAPDTIRFSTASLDSVSEIRNPVLGTPGILAMHNFRASQSRPLLALRGSKMRGAMNMGQHAIDNITKLNTKTASSQPSKDGQLTIEKNGVTSTHKMNVHVPPKQSIELVNHAGTVMARFRDGTVDATSTTIKTKSAEVREFTFTQTTTEQSACTGNKLAYGTSRQLLFCEAGRWSRLDGDPGAQGPNGADAR